MDRNPKEKEAWENQKEAGRANYELRTGTTVPISREEILPSLYSLS
jgi:hypothetical protein